MTQPSRNPFLPADKQPVMVCRTCQHFSRKTRTDGTEDALFGGCRIMGYSNTPHCHTCARWTNRKRARKEEE